MNILKKMFFYIKYGYKATSKSYIKYLTKKGIKIGKGTRFYSAHTNIIDIQRPWMIEIGENVHITAGVSILQHGYDWAVMQKKYGEVLGSSGKVIIGNNVFIGVKSTILKDVHIGDNVIIGANSLVNKDCLEEGVYAGNPVKFIMSLEEYKNKREKEQLKEATDLIIEYKKYYGRYPKKEILREFFWLFEPRNEELCDTFKKVNELSENYEISTKIFKSTKPIFNGYEEFIKYINDMKNEDVKK